MSEEDLLLLLLRLGCSVGVAGLGCRIAVVLLLTGCLLVGLLCRLKLLLEQLGV